MPLSCAVVPFCLRCLSSDSKQNPCSSIDLAYWVSKEVLLSMALSLHPEIFQEGVCCVPTEAVRICFGACPWGLQLKTTGKHELPVIGPVYVARTVSQHSASGCDAHCQSWLSKPRKRYVGLPPVQRALQCQWHSPSPEV